MSTTDGLRIATLTESDLAHPGVQAFCCGLRPCDEEINQGLSVAAIAAQRSGSNLTVLAWDDSGDSARFVGYATVSARKKVDGRPAFLIALFGIDQTHAGRGYGSRFCDQLKAMARELKREFVLIFVDERNDTGLKFWVKQDFVPIGPPPNPYVDSESGVTSYPMAHVFAV